MQNCILKRWFETALSRELNRSCNLDINIDEENDVLKLDESYNDNNDVIETIENNNNNNNNDKNSIQIKADVDVINIQTIDRINKNNENSNESISKSCHNNNNHTDNNNSGTSSDHENNNNNMNNNIIDTKIQNNIISNLNIQDNIISNNIITENEKDASKIIPIVIDNVKQTNQITNNSNTNTMILRGDFVEATFLRYNIYIFYLLFLLCYI
jgi:hypothetical protein